MSNIAPSRFEHVKIVRDPRFDQDIAMILPGEYYVSDRPMIVYTVLGSCVSACIRDPQGAIGGMNHFMLPETHKAFHNPLSQSARYGAFAMEVLINDILGAGGRRERLEVKLFGGGNMFDQMSSDIGRANVEFAQHYLQQEGIRVVSQDVGDVCPRKIFFFTTTGQVLLKKLTRLKNDTILARERAYQQVLKRQSASQDVTLF